MPRRGVVIVGIGLVVRFHAQAVKVSAKLEIKGFVGRWTEKAALLASEVCGRAQDDLDAAFASVELGKLTYGAIRVFALA